ncbi:MAG: hypothetical protein WAN43_02935 [Rhodomicrobium sp.]
MSISITLLSLWMILAGSDCQARDFNVLNVLSLMSFLAGVCAAAIDAARRVTAKKNDRTILPAPHLFPRERERRNLRLLRIAYCNRRKEAT